MSKATIIDEQKLREAFEAWAQQILGDNPTWRESGPCELAWLAWCAAIEADRVSRDVPAAGVSDESCDSVILAIDAWARGVDHYEFGLPIHHDDGMVTCRGIIRSVFSATQQVAKPVPRFPFCERKDPHAREMQPVQAQPVSQSAHGWITDWPKGSGGTSPVYTPGANKPSYGSELNAALNCYPLYASPPKEVPLTDEQKNAMWVCVRRSLGGGMPEDYYVQGISDAEHEHGITPVFDKSKTTVEKGARDAN